MSAIHVEEVSDWLAIVQEAAREICPKMEMLIGGGSARDVLDSVYSEGPLVTRDIDIFFVLEKTVNPEKAAAFFKRLEQQGLGTLKTTKLREKRRCNPSLPMPTRYEYVAGYGVHFFNPRFPILSLSFIHQWSDLKLNGLLNIDKIYLRISPTDTLKSFCDRIVSENVQYADLAPKQFVYDEFAGYPAWVESRPEMLNWNAVERNPSQMAIRIIRSFAKAGKPVLPSDVSTRFRHLLLADPIVEDDMEFRRGFIKIFWDRNWNHVLKSLAEIGILHQISDEMGDIASEGFKGAPGEAANWRDRWDSVLERLTAPEQARLNMEMGPAMANSF